MDAIGPRRCEHHGLRPEQLLTCQCYTILLYGWLGGYGNQSGRLLTIGEVGIQMDSTKNSLSFHHQPLNRSSPYQPQISRFISSHYRGVPSRPRILAGRACTHWKLTSTCSVLIAKQARLARNSVTLGDYRRPLVISQFIKDVHAGFQILNLKNDVLRKRSDGIKYRVKEVEDVVYDLSLRNLIPKE